jgi:hypothetical protein
MAMIGFNYTKLLVERFDAQAGKIAVANNISIKDVTEHNITLDTSDKKSVQISFVFELKYNPAVGRIVIEGNILLLLDVKVAENHLKVWKDKKSLPDESFEQIMQSIFSKCQIQSIVMARDLGLPSPVPLPKIRMEDAKNTSAPKKK